MKFKKKPVVIDAIQWTGENGEEVRTFIGEKDCIVPIDSPIPLQQFAYMTLKTPEGYLNAQRGDWIIRDANGDFYPCEEEIFTTIYEPIVDLGALLVTASKRKN